MSAGKNGAKRGRLHAPQGSGALCSLRIRGPFAGSAELVTCKTCRTWPERLALAYGEKPSAWTDQHGQPWHGTTFTMGGAK